MSRGLLIFGIVLLLLFPIVNAATTNFYSLPALADGDISYDPACLPYTAYNTGTVANMGPDGTITCFPGGTLTQQRAYFSFNTTPLNGCTVTDADLHYNIIAIQKSKRATCDITWTMDIAVRWDEIGGELVGSNWGFGVTDDADDCKTTTGWKSEDIPNPLVNNEGGTTDFELRSDSAWDAWAETNSKKYFYDIGTNESGVNNAYLTVVYDYNICGTCWDGTGNWVINGEDVVCTDQDYDWSGQNITLINGGNLTLINTNITIDRSRSFISGDGVGSFRGDSASRFS